MAGTSYNRLVELPRRIVVVTWSAVSLTFASLALLAFLAAVLDQHWAWDLLVPVWCLTAIAWVGAVWVWTAWRRGRR